MKRNKILFCLLILFLFNSSSHPKVFKVINTKKKYSVLKTLLLCHGSDDSLLKLAKIVSYDLNFTDQFEVEVKKTSKKSKIPNEKTLFSQGISLFAQFKVLQKKIGITIKDTRSKLVLFNKTIKYDEKKPVLLAHKLSAEILKALTGDPGVTLSSIAYCKKLSSHHKIICLSDYSCKKSYSVVRKKAISVAPSWHTKAPILFYSQFTNSNNRLMSVDLNTGKHRIICSYPGLNMQPSFTKDGSRAVVCFSGGRGNSELYFYDPRLCKKVGQKVFKQLTKNRGHNVSPCVLPNKNVVFCSDYETKMPQIYYLDIKKRRSRRLTGGKGYCAAPSFCEKTNMLVYVRPLGGTFQLFTLSLDDLSNVSEQQITFCEGNKHEPSWSQCGRYVIFSLDRPDKRGKRVPQVAVLNHKSGKIRILTHDNSHKSFPRWTSQGIWAKIVSS
jgi:tol-pal system beta propeller repeat protein TolB